MAWKTGLIRKQGCIVPYKPQLFIIHICICYEPRSPLPRHLKEHHLVFLKMIVSFFWFMVLQWGESHITQRFMATPDTQTSPPLAWLKEASWLTGLCMFIMAKAPKRPKRAGQVCSGKRVLGSQPNWYISHTYKNMPAGCAVCEWQGWHSSRYKPMNHWNNFLTILRVKN